MIWRCAFEKCRLPREGFSAKPLGNSCTPSRLFVLHVTQRDRLLRGFSKNSKANVTGERDGAVYKEGGQRLSLFFYDFPLSLSFTCRVCANISSWCSIVYFRQRETGGFVVSALFLICRISVSFFNADVR